MAEKKDVLMQFTVEFGESAKRIGEITGKIRELKDEQEALQYQMKSLEVGTPKYKELATQLAANTEAQKAYRKQLSEESRVVQNAIKADVEYTGSLDAMRARLSTLKTQLGQMTDVFDENGEMTGANAAKYSELSAQIFKLNDNISKQEQSYGVFSRNVGNYANSVFDAITRMGGGFGKSVTGIKSATTALQLMSKTPVIAILGLLARVIEVVVRGLRGNEENANRVAKAFSGFKGIADTLTLGLQALGKIVAGLAERFSKWIGQLAESIPMLDKVNERMKVREDLEQRRQELARQTRESTVEIAKEELAISELRANAAEKDKYTAKERLEFLEEALNRELAISEMRKELAKQEYEIVRDSIKPTGSSEEELQKEAEAQAKMIDAEKEYEEFRRSIQKQIQSAKKEIADEDRQRREEEEEAERERTAALEETARRMTEAYRKIREAAIGDTDEYRIEQIQDRYRELYESIRDNAIMAEDEKLFYVTELERKEQEEIKAIHDASLKAQTDAEIKAAQEQADARKKAYDDELQKNWNNERRQHELRLEYLWEEVQKYKEGTAERAAAEQKLQEEIQRYELARISALEEYASKVMGIASDIVTAMGNGEKRELEQYKKTNNEKKKNLQARYEAGLLSKDDYDYQVQKMDEELDAKELEIERRQAERQKELSIFEIAINTAAAIMRIWAEVPKFDGGITTGILTALATATGAAQIAAVASQPLPMAREGGLVRGASHEQGGVLVNTEGDERIISADPSRAFPELLNLISYIGKHQGAMPATNYGQGGQEGRGGTYQDNGQGVKVTIDYERLAEAVSHQQVWLSLTELRDKEKRYAKIASSARR